MELLQLKYFFESAKNENFAKTAEKFIVPPSSVSASIKRLEKELGCQLFDREANRISLNENGRRLQRTACIIFDELEQARQDIAADNEDSGEIKILVRSSRGTVIGRIIEFNKRFPTARFVTSFDFSSTNYEDYDIIIDEENDRCADFEMFELNSSSVGIRASIDSPLLGRPLRLSQLSDQNFVSMGEDANLYKILRRACQKAGFTPNIVVQTNDAACYRRCIEEGVGLGLSRCGGKASEHSDFLQITDFNERQTIYVYYKKHAQGRTTQNFINFLKDKAK